MTQARLTGYLGFIGVSSWVARENLFALMVTSSCSTIVRSYPPAWLSTNFVRANHFGGPLCLLWPNGLYSPATHVQLRADVGTFSGGCSCNHMLARLMCTTSCRQPSACECSRVPRLPYVGTSSVSWLVMPVLQDQLAALVGHSGTISAGAVVTVICCLLVVNAVFYLGFMHLIYHILLRYRNAWLNLSIVSCRWTPRRYHANVRIVVTCGVM